MDTHQAHYVYELWKSGRLPADLMDTEWDYFLENARRFDENPPEQRYGILPMGAKPSLSNMTYHEDVGWLRCHHLRHISENGIDDGHKVRIFVDWLEKAEGKQR